MPRAHCCALDSLGATLAGRSLAWRLCRGWAVPGGILLHLVLAFIGASSQGNSAASTLPHGQESRSNSGPGPGPGSACSSLSLPLLVPTLKEDTVASPSGPSAHLETSLIAHGQLGYPLFSPVLDILGGPQGSPFSR